MKLVPLGDRVVLKQLIAEETTKSGIVIPGQSKEKPQQAEVIAVGPGGTVDGKEVKRLTMKSISLLSRMTSLQSASNFISNDISLKQIGACN